MGYRQRSRFDEPDVEEVERSRRALMWVAPAILAQQASYLIEPSDRLAEKLFHVVLWAVLTLSLLWFLAGWRFRWLGEKEHALLNDEWHRVASADAMRWGMIGAVLSGIVLSLATLWIEIETVLAINIILGVTLSAAAVRYAWLNRDLPGDDE